MAPGCHFEFPASSFNGGQLEWHSSLSLCLYSTGRAKRKEQARQHQNEDRWMKRWREVKGEMERGEGRDGEMERGEGRDGERWRERWSVACLCWATAGRRKPYRLTPIFQSSYSPRRASLPLNTKEENCIIKCIRASERQGAKRLPCDLTSTHRRYNILLDNSSWVRSFCNNVFG